jgi:transcriptional regulator with XRE-family HTH domain
MLGAHLQYLREREGLSCADLAARAGLTETELARIETTEAVRLTGPQLLALSSSLRLKRAQEFARLVQLNGLTRRFRAYVAGLPKTGTVSLNGIFGHYTNTHEFWQWDTHQQIIAYRQQRLSPQALARFLLARDAAACVELDSAHFNRHYLAVLAELFPDARFIGLIRDPFSWVNSQVNYFTLPKREAIQSRELPNGFPFDLPRGAHEAKAELLRNFPRYAEGIIAYWADSVRTLLAQLPPGRSLVVRTTDLTRRVDDLARFIGVPAETLRRDQTHLNRAEYHVNVLAHCDRALLRAQFDALCGDLLAAYFPEFSLDRFLDAL